MTEASMLAQKLVAMPGSVNDLPKRRPRELSSTGFHARISMSKRVYNDAYKSARPAEALERFVEKRAARIT